MFAAYSMHHLLHYSGTHDPPGCSTSLLPANFGVGALKDIKLGFGAAKGRFESARALPLKRCFNARTVLSYALWLSILKLRSYRRVTR